MVAIHELTIGMDDLIAEFQIDSDGLIEKGFAVGDRRDPRVRKLINYLAIYAPDSHAHQHYPFETISFHPADGLTYPNPTMVVVYKMAPPPEIKAQYGIPEGNFLPGFAVKYDLVTGTSKVKMADLDFSKYKMPKLPWFTRVGWDFGVGVHFSSNPNEQALDLADFYVANPYRWFMRRAFGDRYPEYAEDFKPVIRAYGITTRNGEVVKLKRYIYWKDKELKHLDRA